MTINGESNVQHIVIHRMMIIKTITILTNCNSRINHLKIKFTNIILANNKVINPCRNICQTDYFLALRASSAFKSSSEILERLTFVSVLS